MENWLNNSEMGILCGGQKDDIFSNERQQQQQQRQQQQKNWESELEVVRRQ